MPEERDIDVVARAGMGATYVVWSSSNSTFLGMIREVLALRGAAGAIPDGPAAGLLSAASLRLIKEKTGIENVHPESKDQLRQIGMRELRGVLPLLAGLPDDEADEVRRWLIGIAERVAAAATDRGGRVRVTDAERAALTEIGETLAAPAPAGTSGQRIESDDQQQRNHQRDVDHQQDRA